MTNASTNAIAKIAAVVAGLGLVASSIAAFAPSAKAATVAELEAMIASLTAQLSALSGGSASASFTMDLTIGSTGAEVTALQNWLISKGFAIPAGATGYFGTQTQSALAAYQASVGISPAAGYFGPITRAKVNAAGGSTTGGSTGGSTGGFSGSEEGYLDDFDQLSAFSSEEVGEGEEDKEVLGAEMEAVDADQMITRVTVEIDTPTGNDDLEDLIEDVSLWLDGEELDRMEVDEASHDQSADEYTFRFTGLEGVIEEGEVGELVVAVTGVSNLDTGDAADGWTAAIPADGIRAVSPNGVDDTYGTLIDETFTVNTFATANDVEMQVSLANESPEGSVVNVSLSDDTDGVDLLIFEIEADGSDLNITEIPVTLTTVGGSDVDSVVNRLVLEIDGEEYAETVSTSATAATITFDDLDIDIEDGDTITVTVVADLNDIDTGTFDEGDTIVAEVTATNVDYIEAEDGSGEEISDADATGTALGDAMAFYDVGIMVTLVSAEESVQDGGSNAYDGTGTFTIKYRVEAFDGTVVLSDSATATTATSIPDSTFATGSTGGVVYYVDGGGTATTDDLSDLVTFTTADGATDSSITNGVELTDGESTEFTLTVTRTNDNTGDSGLYRTLLKAISWATTDASTQNVYDFDLEDYKTDAVSIN